MSTLRILFEPTPPHPDAGALRGLALAILAFWAALAAVVWGWL